MPQADYPVYHGWRDQSEVSHSRHSHPAANYNSMVESAHQAYMLGINVGAATAIIAYVPRVQQATGSP